ncbi:hypothetical protein SAMN05216386_2492 [Nitrosospira briensis]|uniref:Uncharacterized protein n=1 Tax=Nitrosospira briensis TaxID=35799 RepID=A0A1I5E0Y6_9PROT|nr:hypothetical protein [Nitrosospira briensis]SFO04960.1 hypothetical protein SAMN05216386_2492 [Nitrosospira briensis]
MASRRKKSAAPPNYEGYPRKAVECEDGKTGEERGRKYARFTTSPELAAYRVINGVEQNSGVDKGIDVPTLMETLRHQAKAVNRGDLAQAEAMLMNQATALQSLFARLTEKAFLAAQLPQFEGFMRMALRAQNQCRATLETLSTIKNPPIVYAKQANVTTGPQQINNGVGSPSHTREIENGQIQLSVEDNELRTDTGTPALTGRVNQEVETMGKIHRTENS